MVKISPSNAGGVGLIPGQEAKIPYASAKKKKTYNTEGICNKFEEDLKKFSKQEIIIQCGENHHKGEYRVLWSIGGATSPVLGLWIKEYFLEGVAFKLSTERPAVSQTWASLVAQPVKNLPAMQETPV